ncbi:MAG: hypothetical protein NXI04_25890 [Planctomycetaceae bacterium]|nr:hypothetical protein [Planctomycetaceae bacterium]
MDETDPQSGSNRRVESARPLDGATASRVAGGQAGKDAEAEDRSDHPFAPPQSGPEVAVTTDAIATLQKTWLKRMAANCIVPTFFALLLVEGYGRLGLPVGILVGGFAGWHMCRFAPALMTDICRGAFAVALTQFYPWLQVGIGLVTVGPFERQLHNPFVVVLATLLTGGALAIVSLVFGVIYRLFKRQPREAPSESRHSPGTD